MTVRRAGWTTITSTTDDDGIVLKRTHIFGCNSGSSAAILSLTVGTSLNFLCKLLQIDKNNLEYTRHHFKDRLYDVNRYFLTGSTYTSWTSKSETGINVPHQKSLRSTTYRRYFVSELECRASHKCWVPTWGTVLKMTSPNYKLFMWIDQTIELLYWKICSSVEIFI